MVAVLVDSLLRFDLYYYSTKPLPNWLAITDIQNADFILSVKGDGSFFCRFYEALSLGRIPFFIDTDCILPFENMIQ